MLEEGRDEVAEHENSVGGGPAELRDAKTVAHGGLVAVREGEMEMEEGEREERRATRRWEGCAGVCRCGRVLVSAPVAVLDLRNELNEVEDRIQESSQLGIYSGSPPPLSR